MSHLSTRVGQSALQSFPFTHTLTVTSASSTRAARGVGVGGRRVARGHFDMWTEEAWDRTNDCASNRRGVYLHELQPPEVKNDPPGLNTL